MPGAPQAGAAEVGRKISVNLDQASVVMSGESQRITHYRCGLVAWQRVRLRKEVVLKTFDEVPTGSIYPGGEVWTVLPGITSDPVLWFRRPNGERCTWDDDAAQVREWFEVLPGA